MVLKWRGYPLHFFYQHYCINYSFMKKSFFIGLSICSALAFFSCGNKSNNNYAVVETTVSEPQDSMMVVNGVIAEQTGPNTLSIVSMEGDTIWFTKDGAIVEGSGIVVGDSAIVYYTMEGVSTNNSNTPKATKIVTKKADKNSKTKATTNKTQKSMK